MSKTRRLLALIGALSLSTSQAQTSTRHNPQRHGVLEGTVRGTLNSQPIAGAKLTLRLYTSLNGGPRSSSSPPNIYGTTNSGGEFRIEGIDPGIYMLHAEKQDFVRQQYSANPNAIAGTTVPIAAGQQLKNINFNLVPFAAIAGHVTEEDGKPASRSKVQIYKRISKFGKPQFISVAEGEANQTGDYRIAGLEPGVYFASGRCANPAPVKGVACVATFYPSTLDELSAQPIEVAMGQSLSMVNLQLKKSPVYRINGNIQFDTNLPSRLGIIVARDTVFPSKPEFEPANAIKPDGTFALAPRPRGAYTIDAFIVGGAPRQVARAHVIVTRQDVGNLILPLVDHLTINGAVRIDASAGNNSVPSSMRVYLASGDIIHTNSPSANISEKGEFKLEQVSSGFYRPLFQVLPPGLWVKSITSGRSNLLTNGITINGAVPPAPIEILLGQGAGLVTGRVLGPNQQARPGLRVTIVDEPFHEERSDRLRSATTDQAGAFRFENLAPGADRLYAWEFFEAAYGDLSLHKTKISQSKQVTINLNSQITVNLTTIPREK